MAGGQFDKTYFDLFPQYPYTREAGGGVYPTLFKAIAKRLKSALRPDSVIDCGCGKGFLVEAFVDLDVNAYGIDISDYAISQIRTDIKNRCATGSIASPDMLQFLDSYDLVTCIEVVEHMPPAEADKAITQICSMTNAVFFSSAYSDFQEPTHINLQPRINWIFKFAKCGFYPCYSAGMDEVVPESLLFIKRECFPEHRELAYIEYIVNNTAHEKLGIHPGGVAESIFVSLWENSLSDDDRLKKALLDRDRIFATQMEGHSRGVARLLGEKDYKHSQELMARDREKTKVERELLSVRRELDELRNRTMEMAVYLSRLENKEAIDLFSSEVDRDKLPEECRQALDDAILFDVQKSTLPLHYGSNISLTQGQTYQLTSDINHLCGVSFYPMLLVRGLGGSLSLEIHSYDGKTLAFAETPIDDIPTGGLLNFRFDILDIDGSAGCSMTISARECRSPIRLLEFKDGNSSFPFCSFIRDIRRQS
ncbi:hypothetical protein MNBD_NITROSPINAE01-1443 [hydrothermal vent metagenome]|uniref:Methyltransferase domain-containing protein n=1 Tax=hydrothermal vent metagenome TaxID=652676 RepID=A0A3B1BU73_9ZZZZ